MMMFYVSDIVSPVADRVRHCLTCGRNHRGLSAAWRSRLLMPLSSGSSFPACDDSGQVLFRLQEGVSLPR